MVALYIHCLKKWGMHIAHYASSKNTTVKELLKLVHICESYD